MWREIWVHVYVNKWSLDRSGPTTSLMSGSVGSNYWVACYVTGLEWLCLSIPLLFAHQRFSLVPLTYWIVRPLIFRPLWFLLLYFFLSVLSIYYFIPQDFSITWFFIIRLLEVLVTVPCRTLQINKGKGAGTCSVLKSDLNSDFGVALED